MILSRDSSQILIDAFKRSFHYEGFDKRKDKFLEQEHTNGEIKEFIGFELGIYGGACYDGIFTEHKGGKNPQIKVEIKDREVIFIKGKDLIKSFRNIFEDTPQQLYFDF